MPRSEFVFFCLTLVGCYRVVDCRQEERQVIFLTTITVGWLFYVFVIGGDFFHCYRHFVPAMALLAFLVAGCGLLTLSEPFRFSPLRVAIFLVLTLLVLTSDLFAPMETWDARVQAGWHFPAYSIRRKASPACLRSGGRRSRIFAHMDGHRSARAE